MKQNLNVMQVLIHIKYGKWCVLAIPKKKKYKRKLKLTFAQWREPYNLACVEV